MTETSFAPGDRVSLRETPDDTRVGEGRCVVTSSDRHPHADLLARLRGFDRRLVEEYGIHAPVLDEAIAALAVVPSVPDSQLDEWALQRAIARVLKRLYPQNPDVVLGREAREIAAAVLPLLTREVSDETRTEGDD